MTEGKSVVYFVHGREAIKIGTTNNLRSRIQNLQTASSEPLALLATVPGGIDLERKLHDQLRQHHKRGEWFIDCGDVRRAINDECGRDVFANVGIQPILAPTPAPSPVSQIQLASSMLEAAYSRMKEYAAFCFAEDRFTRLPRTKRQLIVAAFEFAQKHFRDFREEAELSLFDGAEDKHLEKSAVAASFAEQIECHVEIILGEEDASYLDGWERVPRVDPRFETENGRLRWRSVAEAKASGWTQQPLNVSGF